MVALMHGKETPSDPKAANFTRNVHGTSQMYTVKSNYDQTTSYGDPLGGFFGEGGEIRTHDQLVKSQLLCH